MATVSLDDFDVSGNSWQDMGTTGAVDTLVTNVSNTMVFVVSGGASAPTNKSGTPLAQYQGTIANSDHVWVRTLGPAGKVSRTTI